MAYVSNILVHWTGRGKTPEEQYDILSNLILKKKQLRYNPCDWHFGSKYGRVVNYKVPMICFTDIPLSECACHCAKYSKFGVAFDKAYLANCLASPVAYVQNPFFHTNYVHIYHGLRSLMKVLEEKGIQHWTKVDKTTGEVVEYSLKNIGERIQYLMAFMEDYSTEEFQYNELRAEPAVGQEGFFERADALYFEREWRMILGGGALNLPWHAQTPGSVFFKFEERFLGPVIMPRTFVQKMKLDRERIFADYHQDYVPTILAFEDLMYL